jgi:hypothetical protein
MFVKCLHHVVIKFVEEFQAQIQQISIWDFAFTPTLATSAINEKYKKRPDPKAREPKYKVPHT